MAIPPGSLEIQGATVLLRPFGSTDMAWLKRFLESPAVHQLFWSHSEADVAAGGKPGGGKGGRQSAARKDKSLPPVDWTGLMQWYRSVAADPDSTLLAVTTWSGHLLGYLLLQEIDKSAGRARLEIFFGDRQLWGRGYEEDALRTLLRYAFSSLGLSELRLVLPKSETADTAWLTTVAERSGFIKEVTAAREVWVARASVAAATAAAEGSE